MKILKTYHLRRKLHIGLSPREFSSGVSVRGRSHISRMGNSDLRKILFCPALGCIKNSNYFTPFYLRLLDNGKPKKLAVVAVMRKILLTAMGVLRNQQPFDPYCAEKAREQYIDFYDIISEVVFKFVVFRANVCVRWRMNI